MLLNLFLKRKRLNYDLDQSLHLNTPLRELAFTVFDTETTGFSIGTNDRLIEIGAVHVKNLTVTDRTFQTFVNPLRAIPKNITKLTTIKRQDVEHAPSSLEAIKSFFRFVEDSKSSGWVGHHVGFDTLVIKKELHREKYSYEEPSSFDTMDLIDYLYPSWDQRDLGDYAKLFGSKLFERHRALGDALTTAHLYVEVLKRLEMKGLTTLGDLLRVKQSKLLQNMTLF